MAKKRFVLTVVCTLLLILLSSPLYTLDNTYTSIYNSKGNRISRIDVINTGLQTNRLDVIKHSSEMKASYPKWFKKPDGQGMMIETSLKSHWKNFEITLRAVGDGNVNIALSGPDIKKDNKRFPVLVDYKRLLVNGNEVFNQRKTYWHDDRLKYSIKVKNGDILTIFFTARRHHFQISDLKRFYHFNYCIFLSVLILSFLLSRKLVNYISVFKLAKHYSRIDIVFVCFFFMALLLPALQIDNNEKSVQENRMLAKYVPLFGNDGLNLQYGKQFESWFNDHFWGRKDLIKLNTKIRSMNRYYAPDKALRLSDDWFIGKNEALAISDFTKEQLIAIENALRKYNDFCQANNIKCYIEIVPRKIEFMKKYLPRNVYEQDKAKKLFEYLKSKGISNVIYPLDKLMKQDKKDFVFFKTDHHWTEWGALIGYQELMQRIKLDIPSIQQVSETEYNIFYDNKVRADIERIFWQGCTCNLLNLNIDECPLKTKYRYYKHNNEDMLQVEWDKRTKNKTFFYPDAKNKQKVVIIGNSFTENFVSFLAYTFSHVKKYRYNNQDANNLVLSRWKEEILKFQPDIMLIVIESESSSKLIDLKD